MWIVKGTFLEYLFLRSVPSYSCSCSRFFVAVGRSSLDRDNNGPSAST